MNGMMMKVMCAGALCSCLALMPTTAKAGTDLGMSSLTVNPAAVTDAPAAFTNIGAFSSCSFTVTNHGPAALKNNKPMVVFFFLAAKDSTKASDLIPVGDVTLSEPIPVSSAAEITLTATGLYDMTRYWPDDVTNGEYYVVATVSLPLGPSVHKKSNNSAITGSPISYSGAP